MNTKFVQGAVAAFALAVVPALSASAQGAPELPATHMLTLEAAEAIMEAAQTEAAKNGASSIVIVDTSGAPVLMHRMDGAFPASAAIAQGKAETAAAFRASTTNMEGGVNGPRAALLSSGYMMMQGGLPLMVDDQVVGAIGVSGGTKEQDEAVAAAGTAVLAK